MASFGKQILGKLKTVLLNEGQEQPINQAGQDDEYENMKKVFDEAIENVIKGHGKDFPIDFEERWLDKKDLAEEVFEHSSKMTDEEAFYDYEFKLFEDAESEMRDYIFDLIMTEANKIQPGIEEQSREMDGYDYVMESIMDRFNIEIPTEKLKSIELPMVLTVGSEFDDSDAVQFDDAGKATGVCEPIEWLINSQGYTVDQFLAVVNGEASDSKFLNSLKEEVDNMVRGYGNNLIFFGRTELKYAMEINDNYNKSIVVDKNAGCGFFDSGSGSGSLIDIILEKDVEVPQQNAFSRFACDYNMSYGVEETFGLGDANWPQGNCFVSKD